jgi:putative ABC transport system permease protein
LNTAVEGHGSAYGNPRHFDDQQTLAVDALAAVLTLLVVATAALGVFNTVMVELRDRIHDLGIYKAIGMTPRQTVAMVLTSTAAVGLVAGAIGVPAGVALHHYVIPVMGHAAGTDLPHADVAVFRGLEEVLLGLGGVALAMVAAMIPAGWAARLRTAAALRTE